MNIGRVVLGGLIAGAIINVIETIVHGFFLRTRWDEVWRDLDREPRALSALILIWIVGFVFGILLAWLYGAIRPRYGGGPKTALRAGLYLWIVAGVLVWIGLAPLRLWPTNLMIIGIITNLVAYVVAALVAGYLYREAAAA